MNLLQVREQFVRLCGRYDLIEDTTNWADAGADFFIREGVKFLDLKSSVFNEESSIFRRVQVGDYYVALQRARSITSLWFYTPTARYKLREIPRESLRQLFPSLLSTNIRGIPSVYAPVRGRLVGGAAPRDFLHGVQFFPQDINGLVFSPLSQPGTMEAIGKFYSDELNSDGDENYWTLHHPMLLVWAALYHLEVSYRNTSGAEDWMAAIKNTLREIEMDAIEEDTAHLTQLGGFENE